MRSSRLLTIERAGHMTPAEQPEAVNEALRSFFDELSAYGDGGSREAWQPATKKEK